jgi:hypothetical protein
MRCGALGGGEQVVSACLAAARCLDGAPLVVGLVLEDLRDRLLDRAQRYADRRAVRRGCAALHWGDGAISLVPKVVLAARRAPAALRSCGSCRTFTAGSV